MTANIKAAIEGLYEAFSDVPKPLHIGYCPHCYDDDPYPQLLAKPLKSITGEDIYSYVYSVFSTAGDTADFLYYFPRMCELGVYEDIEIELVLKKAALDSGWQNWKLHHKNAFLKFADSFFDAIPEVQIEGGLIDDWICGLSFMIDDISSKLDIFLVESEISKVNLVSFYEMNSGPLIKKRLSNAFWEKDYPNYKRIVEWFYSPEVVSKLNQVYNLL